MGNKFEKSVSLKDRIYVQSLFRSIIDSESDKSSAIKPPKIKKNSCIHERNKILDNKNVLAFSSSIAEEIVKRKVRREFYTNSNVYSSVLVFDNLGLREENGDVKNKNKPILSFANSEKDELSNFSQMNSAEEFLFKSSSLLRGERLLQMRIADEVIDITKNDNFMINILTGGENTWNDNINNQNDIKNVNDIKDKNKINTIENIKENNIASFLGNQNDLSFNSKHTNNFYQDKSFDDISLQEYLRMETERLKKERIKNGTITNAENKERNIETIKNNSKDSDEMVNKFLNAESDKQKYGMYNLNMMKNKHLERNKRNTPTTPTLERSNTIKSKMGNVSKSKTNKSLTNIDTSQSRILQTKRSNSKIKISSLKGYNSVRNGKKVDNFEYFSQRKYSAMSPSTSTYNNNQTRVTNSGNSGNSNCDSITKITSRPPSCITARSKSKSKSNFFKNPPNNKAVINHKNSDNDLNKYKYSKVNLLNLNQSTQTNQASPTPPPKKQPIACIKIDIRDLLKEEAESSNIITNNDLKTSDKNISDYINKFKDTNRSYSEILTKNEPNYVNESNDIDDFIITKQKLDEFGNILIN